MRPPHALKSSITSGAIKRATNELTAKTAMRRSAFGYQDFDYFAYLIWEQTHKDSLYGKPTDGSSGRHYSRKNPYNQKRLKQTVFRLPDGGNNEAA